MSYKEYIKTQKSKYVGKKIWYNDKLYTIVDVDYNGMFLIDRPTEFNDTTAVDPLTSIFESNNN